MNSRSANQLPREDALPWYRQFWPWFLIALPASVVVAGFATLFIANRHADDLVVDEYYKDGLAINQQLEKKRLAQELGIEAELRIEGETVAVQMSGAFDAGMLSMRLSHPLEADLDFSVPLTHAGSGRYRGRLERPVARHWHWTLEQPGQAPWRLDGTLDNDDFADGPR